MREFAERATATPPRRPQARVARRRPQATARGRCWSARRSGSGTSGATSRSRASCATLHPGLEVEWLAQHPVTTVLEAQGERIHPASAELAPEAAHVDAETGEHELNAFQMLRRLDEIFIANFMVFHDVVQRRALRPLDRRRGLGGRLLPAREPGAQDRALRLAHRLRRHAADARGRRARGVPRRRPQRADGRARRRASRVCATARSSSASPDDIVAEPLGPGLPAIGDWTREHFDVRRLRHRLRRRPRSPTATRCAPSSATGPTRRSASSPPAARPPGSTCSSAPRPRSRRRAGASRGCA